MGYIYMKVNTNGKIQYLMKGSIYNYNKFSMLTMTIMESGLDKSIMGWNNETGLVISASAESRESFGDHKPVNEFKL